MARTSQSIEALLIALAIASRIACVWVLQSHRIPHSTYEHGEIAANLLAGRGFSMMFLGADGPTSQQAPVYPAIVAVAYAIGGVETPRSLLLLESGQAVLGGLLVLGVLRLCRLVAPGRQWMAWSAGLAVALHPTLVYAATHVQVALLGATLLTWTLAWAYQTRSSGRTRDAGITGGLLALLALTDPILVVSVIGIAWAIWQREHRLPSQVGQSFRLLAVVATVALAGVSPWLVRNFLVHREFVAIKSTFGYAFWQGNCAMSAGTDKVVRPSVERILHRSPKGASLSGLNRTLWQARHEAGYLDDIALTRDDYRLLGSVTEPERSRILFRRALADLEADQSRYGRLCLRRLRYFIFFDETNPKSRVLAYRLPHLGLTVFAAIGLLLAPASLRNRLLPTFVTVSSIAVFHALTIMSARFHIPVEPFLAIWGSTGLTRWGVRGHSGSAGHHVKSIRVVDRLAVAHGAWDLGLMHCPRVHRGQFQAGGHRERADEEGAPPGDCRHDHGVARS
jgi:hypothetical protein